jgi:SnoaL-like domain
MATTDRYAALGVLAYAPANLEVVREAYRALERGDEEGFFAAFADDVVAYDAEGLPYGGTYPGKDGLRRLTHLMFNAWEKVSWKVVELTGGGRLRTVALSRRPRRRVAALLLRHQADRRQAPCCRCPIGPVRTTREPYKALHQVTGLQ